MCPSCISFVQTQRYIIELQDRNWTEEMLLLFRIVPLLSRKSLNCCSHFLHVYTTNEEKLLWLCTRNSSTGSYSRASGRFVGYLGVLIREKLRFYTVSYHSDPPMSSVLVGLIASRRYVAPRSSLSHRLPVVLVSLPMRRRGVQSLRSVSSYQIDRASRAPQQSSHQQNDRY